MSALNQAAAWLQAKFLERGTIQTFTAYDRNGQRESTEQFAAVTLGEFHDWLLSIGAPVAATVEDCRSRGWIDVMGGGHHAAKRPTHYWIRPAVCQAAVPARDGTSSMDVIKSADHSPLGKFLNTLRSDAYEVIKLPANFDGDGVMQSVEEWTVGLVAVFSRSAMERAVKLRVDAVNQIARAGQLPAFEPLLSELWQAYSALHSAAVTSPLETMDDGCHRKRWMPLSAHLVRLEQAIERVHIVWPAVEQDSPSDAAILQPTPAVKPKRSTAKNEARLKIVAALLQHHKYDDGSCLNLEPIGNNELARLADVARSTVSEFLADKFGSRDSYIAKCRDAGSLANSLKLLNGDFSPAELFGRSPPNERDADDDE